jgi:hypothetical protein
VEISSTAPAAWLLLVSAKRSYAPPVLCLIKKPLLRRLFFYSLEALCIKATEDRQEAARLGGLADVSSSVGGGGAYLSVHCWNAMGR